MTWRSLSASKSTVCSLEEGLHFPHTIFSPGKGELGAPELPLGRQGPRTGEMGVGQGEEEVAHLPLPRAGERKK